MFLKWCFPCILYRKQFDKIFADNYSLLMICSTLSGLYLKSVSCPRLHRRLIKFKPSGLLFTATARKYLPAHLAFTKLRRGLIKFKPSGLLSTETARKYLPAHLAFTRFHQKLFKFSTSGFFLFSNLRNTTHLHLVVTRLHRGYSN